MTSFGAMSITNDRLFAQASRRFFVENRDKVHFFNRGYLCGLHFSDPWFFPFYISGPAWA